MVSRVTLQNIVDADWTKQYLASTGEVESRSIFSPVVQLLRKILPAFISEAILPKADIFAGADAVKRTIIQLHAENPTAESDLLTKAAEKINNLVTYFATKQPERSAGWMEALIDVKTLIATPTSTRVEEPVVENQPVVEQPVLGAPTPSNTQSTPEDEQVVVPTTPQETQTVATPLHDDLPDILDLPKLPEEQEVPVQREGIQENVREIEDPTPAEALKLAAIEEANKARVREEKRQARRAEKAAEKTAKKAAEAQAKATAASAPKKPTSRKHRTDSSVTKK